MDATALAGLQHLHKRGNGLALRGVVRGKDILRTQVVEQALRHPDRFRDLGIPLRETHRPVDGPVVHDDQDAVQGVFHIHLDGRIAETGRHFDAGNAVLGDQVLQMAAAVRAHLGEGIGRRTCTGSEKRQDGKGNQYLFHNKMVFRLWGRRLRCRCGLRWIRIPRRSSSPRTCRWRVR